MYFNTTSSNAVTIFSVLKQQEAHTCGLYHRRRNKQETGNALQYGYGGNALHCGSNVPCDRSAARISPCQNWTRHCKVLPWRNRTFPHLFVGGYMDSSFFKISMIFRAEPSSFNTSHSCDSYSLDFLQLDSWILPVGSDKV